MTVIELLDKLMPNDPDATVYISFGGKRHSEFTIECKGQYDLGGSYPVIIKVK